MYLANISSKQNGNQRSISCQFIICSFLSTKEHMARVFKARHSDQGSTKVQSSLPSIERFPRYKGHTRPAPPPQNLSWTHLLQSRQASTTLDSGTVAAWHGTQPRAPQRGYLFTANHHRGKRIKVSITDDQRDEIQTAE